MTQKSRRLVLLFLLLCVWLTFSWLQTNKIPEHGALLNAMNSPTPVTTIAKVQVKQDKESEFLKATTQLVEQSRQEEGVSFFSFYRSVENPREFLFYEIFNSFKALEIHRKENHTKEWFSQVKDYLDGSPKIQNLSEILENQE